MEQNIYIMEFWKLKKNRKYYVQIRTKSGKKYSAWSKVKTISKR